MALEEKRAWITALVTACGYVTYLVIILSRTGDGPLAKMAYVAALVMAMAEVDHFWIANAIYLAFALSGLLDSVAKVFAYRRGFQSW